MEVRTEQVVYGILEAFAAHNILHYMRSNSDHERVRLATGATMAGLGFALGPELEERIHDLRAGQLSEEVRKRAVYATGGAMLGALAGNMFKSKSYLLMSETNETDLVKSTQPDIHSELPTWFEKITSEKPGGLLTVASVGWLGYSIFWDGKTDDEKKRHLWGLGAGAFGYMYGPEALGQLRGMMISEKTADQAIEIHSRGAAIIGGIAGGVLGWMKGQELLSREQVKP